ncbi:MAG: hypothetical protein LBJ46_09035 [Planctomycetota bacterium]|jgi:hypothetical protein|nr:hypothetical protein [Planctomycetota bacterium]
MSQAPYDDPVRPDRSEATEPVTPGRREMTPGELQETLSRLSGNRVLLVVTDNRRRMVSVRRGGPGFREVRLQRIFLSAPDEVVRALAAMAAGRGGDRAAIRAFIAEALPAGRKEAEKRSPTDPPTTSTPGMFHDIHAYARELNSLYLDSRSTADIAWGRSGGGRIRRSIQFGSYDPVRNLITMNRRLDRSDIPRYFIEYILFHEMLHEVLGIGERPDGRRDIHGRIFKLMESTFPDFDKAARFERELVKRLDLL